MASQSVKTEFEKMASRQKGRKRVIVAFIFIGVLGVAHQCATITSRSLAVYNEEQQVPLKWPLFICQFGRPRSATTFQAELLKAIVNLKSPPGTNVPIPKKLPTSDSETPFGVLKTHSPWVGMECVDKGYPIFTSDRPDDLMHVPGKWDDKFKVTLHHQSLDEAEKCSLCQVDHYQSIFALSDEDVTILKRYMDLYEKIRQCCGLQMSKYNRARLHGCDMTPYQNIPSAPMCEIYNMQEIEEKFHNLPIAYEASSPDRNWSQPGDCAKFDEMIINGRDFNGAPWDNKCP